MSGNIIAIPHELYQSDLPQGYDCTLYVGRMVGKLGSAPDAPAIQEFDLEISDRTDETEVALRYVSLGAPAGELARWENVGDTVGIVIARKDKRLDMVLAYNGSRRKWFATGYYPHIKDHSLANKVTAQDIRQYVMLSLVGIFLCGLGLLALPILIFVSLQKAQQFKVLNPTGYRGVTAKRIADWMTTNRDTIFGVSNPKLDPSL